MSGRATPEIIAGVEQLVADPCNWPDYLAHEIVDRLVALEAEVGRVRHALSADSVLEMVTRLAAAADIYDPADDYLLNAARVVAAGMVP